MNKILFFFSNNKISPKCPETSKNTFFNLFLQAWAQEWNKIWFFRTKIWYSPHVLKRSKQQKYFLPFIFGPYPGEKCSLGQILYGTGPILWGPVPKSPTHIEEIYYTRISGRYVPLFIDPTDCYEGLRPNIRGLRPICPYQHLELDVLLGCVVYTLACQTLLWILCEAYEVGFWAKPMQ